MPEPTDPAWSMERTKRRLDAVPALLGSGSVWLCGLPAGRDVVGALRVEGLLALLAAAGRQAHLGEVVPRDAPRIWLGGATQALATAGAKTPILLWPSPDAPGALPAEAAAALAWPHWVHCHALPLALGEAPAAALRRLLLPDPSHALWGLLDQHPRAPAEARLELLGEAPPALLGPVAGPAWKHMARAAIAGLPAPQAARLGRRWRIARARHALLAAEAVATDRIGHGILAALLGRRVAPRATTLRDYWAAWAPAVLEPAA